VNIPKPEEIPNIDLQVMNYHKPMLGTYHCKYMVVDRKYAVLQSNNIQDNDNMEMMTQLEGPIVDSLYDMALISWHKVLEPPLPSLNSPASQSGVGSFGDTSHHEMFRQGEVQVNAPQPSDSNQLETADIRGVPSQNLIPGEDAGLREAEQLGELSNDSTYKPSPARNVMERAINAPHLPPLDNIDAQNPSLGLNDGQQRLGKDPVTNAFLRAGSSSLPSSFISDPLQSKPLPEHLTTDPHYDIDIAGEVARVQQSVSPNDKLTRLEATAAHLNHTKNVDFPSSIADIPAGDEFTPYIPHEVHEPFPIAMVNRPPYGTPNNNDVYTPQNEAWLAGLRYANKNVFIQSPTLNAEPILKEILNACERGVDVFAFICVGYNDAVGSHKRNQFSRMTLC
jgi:phosphatidylserine/phosphatidylglycerophosphate/cardiolipin synthase-like enzyme